MTNGKRQIREWARENLVDLCMLVAAVVLATVLMQLITGCAGTVAPRTVTSKAASWDGTNQNSGLICFLEDGRALITPHARDRYNALVPVYGDAAHGFSPALKPDDGVSPTGTNAFIMDQQHLQAFMVMNHYRKQEQK